MPSCLNDFSRVLNKECHIGEFYPSLLRLTLEVGLKLCWIILRWYQATIFIENCVTPKNICIDLVPRAHAFSIRGDQCKKVQNQKSRFRPFDCAEALKLCAGFWACVERVSTANNAGLSSDFSQRPRVFDLDRGPKKFAVSGNEIAGE